MTIAAIGLGGNIGDARATLAAALDALSRIADLRLLRVSSLYETPPWGKTDQPNFLNAAASIGTQASARRLLDQLLQIEANLGRERTERWGPRIVDLDILTFGEQAVDQPGLRIPHSRLTERGFALLPLAEILPDALIAGRTATGWLSRIDTAGIVRIAGPDWYRDTPSVEAYQGGSDGA